MSIRLTWLPNTEADIDHYDWQRAPDNAGVPGTWADLVSIDHDLLGPNYDPTSNRFFYIDLTGTTDNWYRIRAVDTEGNESGWGNHFQPSESTTPPPFPNTVTMNQDYGGANELQPTDNDTGLPVEGVQIRVYKKIDYDLQNFEAAVGVTTSDADGGWENPITVEAAFTYVIQYFKPGNYGPNTHEVIVP
jgi:hypothetical protein